MLSLKNPYDHLKDDQVLRIQTDIGMEDKLYLSSIVPLRGVFQTTINILLHDLINELRSLGITQYSPDNLALYVECVRRRTNLGSSRCAAKRDDTGSTPGLHNTNALPASVATIPNFSVDSRPDKRKGKRKGNKG